ncbi:MAG: hypothetical protein OEN50_08680 [Deltaproteobacteria bacterium]|nr:hypothetical protein [Deltaproteobacteria bacterium]
MGIHAFTFCPGLTRDFVRFGYELYQGDSRWIPPFEDEQLAQLSPEFCFHQTPGNCHMNFLATTDNRVVGRASAMVNRDLKGRDGQPVGTVGFFECIDDYAVAKDLFDATTQWLGEKQGIRSIWGPMNFDIWHGYRLMTRGFDQRPFYGEPYNKPYYQDFFERYGFTSMHHWNSVEVSGRKTLERLAEPGKTPRDSLPRQGYRFESFDPDRLRQELRKLHSVLSLSFSGFLGYTPISANEFERLYHPVCHATRPGLFLFAYDESNRPCGFAAGLFELSAAVRAMRGKNGLIAKTRFLYRRLQVDRIIFHLIGKTPQESLKRNGLGGALFTSILQAILAQGYETFILTLMSQGNPSRRFLQELAGDDQRQYALYKWNS